MVAKTPQELRSKFIRGYVPTEQDYTDLFDTYIASINGNRPNASGNVEVPVEYAVLPEIMATDLPSSFQKGTSVAVIDYNATRYPGWKSVFDEANATVQDGQVIIITQSFPEQNLVIQEVDIARDGTFLPTLTRASLANADAWGTLRTIPRVQTVNGVVPDELGNVVVSGAGEQGPEGPIGPRGPEGPIGPAGPAGPKGDTGAQGVAGIQGIAGPQGQRGPAGPQGPEGPEGPRGQGFEVAGMYSSLANAEIALANETGTFFFYISSPDNPTETGNVYLFDNGQIIYQFTANGIQGPEGPRGPAGAQGPQGEQGLVGPTGPQGPQGLQGLQGPAGPQGATPTLVDATTTSKGIVQVGSGLSVNAGTLSVTSKQHLMATRITNAQAISTINTKVLFNSNVSGAINYVPTTGDFTLQANRRYRITVSASFTFPGANDWIQLSIYNNTTNAVTPTGVNAIWHNAASTVNEISAGPLDVILVVGATGSFSVRCSAKSNGVANLRQNYSHLIIQEL